MATPQFKIQLDQGATLPTRATDGSIGYDVKCLHATAFLENGAEYPLSHAAHIIKHCFAVNGDGAAISSPSLAYVELDTGIHITPPKGYYVELVPNSRQGKRFVSWHNSLGVIDPDYTGSIKVIIKKATYDLQHYLPGNTIGQLIIRKKHDADWQIVDQLTPTERGSGGFGSTANIAKSAQ